MSAIAIKDLELHLGNPNLPLGRSAICFELLAQKKETGKYTADAQYYKYQEFVSQGHMPVLEKPRPKPPFCIKIRFLQSSENAL